MVPTAVPAPGYDEARRLAALQSLALLDSGPEREFDALVALTADMLGCPTAMLNLIDRDRQWVKARFGPGPDETSREIAFCDRTIQGAGPMIVDDATVDVRFAGNPMVLGADGIRFYAGMPIHAIDGAGHRQPIGALCVLDAAPRCLDERGRQALAHLAMLAEALIAARAVANRAVEVARVSDALVTELARKDGIFRQAERMAMMGSFRVSLDDNKLEWSENVYRIHGLPIGRAPPIDGALDHYEPVSRARVAAAIARTIETGESFDIEENFFTAQAERRRVRSMGELERIEGRPVAIVGVFQDITDRYELEKVLRRSADTDMLTGLCNRASFERLLDAAIHRARGDDAKLVLAMIDLDGFKAINDTLGHLAGDDVLRGVGRALRAPWLAGSCAARLGGDEFAVVIEDVKLIADPAALGRRLEEGLRVPVSAGALGMIAAGTVGIAALDAEHEGVRDLVQAADTLLYAAKRDRIGERRRADRRMV
ncbi:sensor domain-containing diguanylate cyclase [Sphingomonas bacterium]|uniref:sensor domain-containing diguanylate cyclase n=1 Tax=Sphingomonas bacterium TaxID=1895847 RepID=UPI0015767EDE|nr:sensor domain-containing diguanylate cyclase [Sphingomonas bacterium]